MPPLRTLAIPTADRPQALARCAGSYARNAAAHGRPLRIIVADDSAERAADNRAVLARVAGIAGVEVWYLDAAGRRELAGRLAEAAGVPVALLEHALMEGAGGGRAYGANRNALLLHTAGEPFLFADDDTEARVAAAPHQRPGLALSSLYKPVRLAYLGDRTAAGAAVDWIECDLLGLHEQVLGRDSAACVAELAAGGCDDGDAGSDLLARVRPPAGRVRATWMGHAGDTGSDNLHDFFTASPEQAGELLAHFGDGLDGRARASIRYVPRLTLSSGLYWPMPCTGYDHRDPLPPFAPTGRSEDFLFAQALEACFPRDCRAYLPWLVAHEPGDARVYPEAGRLIAAATGLLANHLLAMCVESLPVERERSGAAALVALGEHLIGLSELPADRLAGLLAARVAGRRRLLAGLVERTLAAVTDPPPAWVRLGQRFVAALRASAASPSLLAIDLPATGEADAVARFRPLLARHGALLRMWPQVLAAAGELRAAGRAGAQRVRP